MGKDLLRYRDAGQTISFGDINEALGFTRVTTRTIGNNNTMAYTASFYRLPSTPYLHRVSNGGIPKVSQWYNYYDRQIAWRGFGTGTCVIDTSSLTTPSVVISVSSTTRFSIYGYPITPDLVSNSGTGKVYTATYTGINGTNYTATNVTYNGLTGPVNVGNYQGTLYVAADGNYNAGVSNTVTWTITPLTPYVYPIYGTITNSFSDWSIRQQYYTYNGSPQGPTTAMSLWGLFADSVNVLEDIPPATTTTNQFATGTNYTFIYSSTLSYNLWGPTTSLPTKPGEYKVTATVAAHGNFATASGLLTWYIDWLTPVVTPTVGTYIYNGSAQGPTTGTNTGTGNVYTSQYKGILSTTYGPSTLAPTNVGNYQVTMSLGYSADGIYKSAIGTANFDILAQFRVSIYPDGATTTGTNFVNYFNLKIFTNQMWDIDIKVYNYLSQYIANYTIASSTKVINSLNPLEYKFTSTQIGYYAAGYYTIVITQISTSYSVTRNVSTLGG